MGADEDSYRAQQIERENLRDYELYEENIVAFNLFQEVMTQFRYVVGTKVIPTGLDYAGVMTHLKCFYDKKEIPDLMRDLQVIERAYIKARHG